MFEHLFGRLRVAVTSTPIVPRSRWRVDELEEARMRLYDDPVEVRRGESEGPDQFLWHGRLWKVRAVLAHWVETAPWWHSAIAQAAAGTSEGQANDLSDAHAPPAVGDDLLVERELWRVEAGRGMTAVTGPDGKVAHTSGVFDLSFTWSDGRWQLVGCAD